MFSFRQILTRFLATACVASSLCAPAAAQDLRAERDRLAAHIQANPEDDEATYRFVVIATELRDYEGGVGALERLLMFNPNLSRARKELGFLYARLGNWELSAQHLRAARASGALDAVQIAQIDAQLPDVEKRAQPNRLSVRLQTGVRAQSNANFFPANTLFQFGGLGLLSGGARQGDVNTFQLVNAAHDYEFGNQRGDQLETRVTAYATQQFNLPQYSVALFSGSVGPRFFVPQSVFANLSVRPYVTGAVTMLGSSNYLNTGGAGASVRAELTPDFWLEPGAEWRSLWVDPARGPFFGVSPFATLSTLATGDAVTGYVSGAYSLLDNLRLEGRFGYTRASAFNAVQSSDQFDAQAMLRVEVDPLHPIFGRRWTIAPYARFTHLAFDAPNPIVSPFVARRDAAWTYGIMLDAPVTPMFGFAGNLEFSRNDSNLPNFRTQNVSVSFGPTAKF
ncbi:MAG: tetratricopeptide repeat protein [Methylocystis sp.]|uniref:tetratricopeptide repeat protein n=1 Tax=Methylocystis sp. TaxID=1911079 RepID=UPI003DA25B40